MIFLLNKITIKSTTSVIRLFSNRPWTNTSRNGTTTRSIFPMTPGFVTPRRSVPDFIQHPDYSKHGTPNDGPNHVVTYSQPEHLEGIRHSAKLARKMLDFANSLVKPGVTTEEIDILTHNEIVKNGAYPSPINYHGFPKAICTSVNEVVCHGIPNDRKLIEGDVISIDVSLFKNGFHGDNCGTVVVGTSDDATMKLINATQESLDEAIKICKPGSCLSLIGETIENVAKSHNFNIVHEFMGHGVGPFLHMKPLVRHFKNTHKFKLVKGMVFTIEPILVEGARKITIWDDGWTAITLDGGRYCSYL